MKVWKLVSGILSIVLSMFVVFQSCAAGLSNTLEENGEVGGSFGFLVSIMMLSGGIVSIAVRKSEKVGGDIAVIILFLLGALMGFGFAGSYSDLNIWAGWCAICAFLALLSAILKKKKG